MLAVAFYHFLLSTGLPLGYRNCTGCRYAEFRGHKAEINVLPDTVSRPCTVETTNLKNKVLKIMTLLSGNISFLASASQTFYVHNLRPQQNKPIHFGNTAW